MKYLYIVNEMTEPENENNQNDLDQMTAYLSKNKSNDNSKKIPMKWAKMKAETPNFSSGISAFYL